LTKPYCKNYLGYIKHHLENDYNITGIKYDKIKSVIKEELDRELILRKYNDKKNNSSIQK